MSQTGVVWRRVLGWRPRTFRGQIVVSTMLLTMLLVVAVAGVTQILLEATADHEVDAALTGRGRSVVDSLDRESTGARITIDADALDPGEVVYAADGHRVSGSVERRARATADALGRAGRADTEEAGDDVRLRATPFTTGSGAHGTVVVSQVTTPYERSEAEALLATLGLGVVVVAAAGGIAARVSRLALRPVAQMSRAADEWSESDLSRRFGRGAGSGPAGAAGAGARDEIGALGQTLDRLLERVERVILAEQRLSAELAHELRTPLSVVRGSAELALLRGGLGPDTTRDLELISRAAAGLGLTITTLLDLAAGRADSSGETCSLAQLSEEVARLVPSHLRLRIAGVEGLRSGVPLAMAVRALSPVVDNAARHAVAAIALVGSANVETVSLAVRDDGPGFSAEAAEHAFEPGWSGADGTGLGLALARRVAESLGGELGYRTCGEGRDDRDRPGGSIGSGEPAGRAAVVLTLPRAT